MDEVHEQDAAPAVHREQQPPREILHEVGGTRQRGHHRRDGHGHVSVIGHIDEGVERRHGSDDERGMMHQGRSEIGRLLRPCLLRCYAPHR